MTGLRPVDKDAGVKRPPRAHKSNRLFFIALGIFSMLFNCCSKPAPQAGGAPEPHVDGTPAPPAQSQPQSRFHTGQMWAFHAPAGQPDARLIILKVEDGGKLGTLVHVALKGVLYGNGQTTVGHLPFTEKAVEQSVTTLESESVPLPDYLEGYMEWRRAFDNGKAGVFTITVGEAFSAVTKAMGKAPPQQ